MLGMQAFYNRLVSPVEGPDQRFQRLERLSHCSLAQVRAIQSDLYWELWDSETA